MQDPNPNESDFLSQITNVVGKNMSNEQFGVSELADEMNMSRSNLLRKVKKLTNLSVSQLISKVRLTHAMELLRKSSLNVSEVSHQVGFSSTSYFIKCFREYYGYPPGEVGKREAAGETQPPVSTIVPESEVRTRSKPIWVIGLSAAVILVTALCYFLWPASTNPTLEKSIAVLPFKNDSNDSTNVYLINGLMESMLNNLQKVQDLKVISRTSSEKYRNTTRTIPEMARELNVNYFVEGSGQKVGDKILLNIQLIEAVTDKHLWAKQYRRETKDIFELQQEIAQDITKEIQAIITPEEEQRIAKHPTDDVVAYDFFMKGHDLMQTGGTANLEAAIGYFKKAIERDKKFALAYALAAIGYYYLDIYQSEKKYVNEIRSFADHAMTADPKLSESLVAKALFYMHGADYKSAVPYLEKALEYKPNSILAISFLGTVYNYYIPNTAKYLEYALMGVRLDIASQDSVTTSYSYLRLSDALLQAGFVDESLTYINKSLQYNPKNPYSEWVKTFIIYAKDKDVKKARQRLLIEYNKDTTNINMVEEMAKICYMQRDYASAYHYYQKFIVLRDTMQLDIYGHEDIKIAFVFEKMGKHKEAKPFVEAYRKLAENEKSIYKKLLLSGYYAYVGDATKAIELMREFAQEENFKYWMLWFESDPSIDQISDHPEFRKVMKEIETKFWRSHEEIKTNLKEKRLL